MRNARWTIVWAGLLALVVVGCEAESTGSTKDATTGTDTTASCKTGDPVPASLDLKDQVFRVIELRMEHPDSDNGYIKTTLNGLWATDIDANVLNLFFKIKAWQPAEKKLTLAIGTGKWDAAKSEYYWDAVPSDVELELDNPNVKTPGRYGVGTLNIWPAAVNAPIHIINLAIQGQLDCDGVGIYGGALQGSITRADALPLKVQLKIGGSVNEIGLVDFLELAGVHTDKVTKLPNDGGIAEPCPFTAELNGKPVADGWCIPKKDTAFYDKDCAKTQNCAKGDPQNDADDERCAVEVKDNAVAKTVCVKPDAWHFIGTFSAEKIDKIRDAP